MKFDKTIDIKDNVITVTIGFNSFGTDDLTAEEEQELIENFPQKLRYSDIEFSEEMVLADGVPVKASEDGDDEGDPETVSLNLINREYVIDSEFNIEMIFDVNKATVGTVFNTKALAAQAQAQMFVDKILEQIGKLLANARKLSPTIETVEGTEEVIL